MENYALIEHFKLVKNGNVEGIKCDYFQGNQGNILIPREQIIESLKIKNDGGFAEIYEKDYLNELYPYYTQISVPGSEFDNSPALYLEPEGLRKYMESQKKNQKS